MEILHSTCWQNSPRILSKRLGDLHKKFCSQNFAQEPNGPFGVVFGDSNSVKTVAKRSAIRLHFSSAVWILGLWFLKFRVSGIWNSPVANHQADQRGYSASSFASPSWLPTNGWPNNIIADDLLNLPESFRNNVRIFRCFKVIQRASCWTVSKGEGLIDFRKSIREFLCIWGFKPYYYPKVEDYSWNAILLN